MLLVQLGIRTTRLDWFQKTILQKKLYELCIVVIVSCFQASFYGSGGCWGERDLWGRREQKWLFTLHSDQNFQGTPETLDSKTGTRPVKRNTKASAFAITLICQLSSY